MSNSIATRILDLARSHPDRIAIHHRGRTVCYRDLAERVTILAGALAERTGPGPVAIQMGRTPDMIATMLASWCAGHAFVSLDPRQPIERRHQILHDSRPVLFVHDDGCPGGPLPPTPSMDFKNLLNHGVATGWQAGKKEPQAGDLAYLLFTSGSTGRPKGIAITHGSVQALIEWSGRYFNADELGCVLASTTTTFDLSIFEIFVPLSLGTSIYLVDSILDLVDAKNDYTPVTLINTVPSAIREILRSGVIPPHAHTLCLAGEALSWDLVNAVYRQSPIRQVFNLWGPSEDTTYSTVWRCPASSMPRPETGPVPIGSAITGTTVIILDPTLAPVPPGEKGEICLAGKGLAQGYDNNPELTEERFPMLRLPNGQSRRIYRTGDWGWMDIDGIVHFLGRMDLQVKIRGHRVELEEIEGCLLAAPSVREAVVLLLDHPERPQLAAILTCIGMDAPADADMIALCREYLAARLPDYMLPHQWHIQTEPLPRTMSGKIDRKSLQERYAGETVAMEQPGEGGFLAMLTRILGPVEDLGRSFLDSGGDSLSAVHLLTLAKSRWEGNLSLATILSPDYSLRDLIRLAESQPLQVTKIPALPLSPAQLSPIEQRMWKIYSGHHHPEAYNIGVLITISGRLDAERLLRAIAETAAAGRALTKRLAFSRGDAWYREMPLPPPDRQQTVPDSGMMESLCAAPFDLEHEVPFRYRLIMDGKGGWCLGFCFAHTAIDGYGLRAWMAAISAHYQGTLVPGAASLGQPAMGWPTLEEAAAYWVSRLNNLPAGGSWPAPWAYQPDGCYDFTLRPQERVLIVQQASQYKCTLPAFLLATMFIALQRLGGGEDLVIGCPVSNRLHPDDLNRVANLTNTLPVRCRPLESLPCASFLREVQGALEEVLAFQSISIDQVLGAIAGGPTLDGLLDVLFSYMDFLQDLLPLPGCRVKADFHQPSHAKAPLVLSAIVTADGALRFVLEFQGHKVSADWAKTFMELFQHLLSTHAVGAEQTIGSIEAIPPRQEPMLRELFSAAALPPGPPDLITWLETVIRRHPGRTAIVDGEEEVSYERLWLESARLAAGLQDQDIRSGTPVGLCMGRSWRLVAAMIGILRAGAFYVPLVPRNPVARNHLIADQSRIHLAITDELGNWGFPCLPYTLLAKSCGTFRELVPGPDDPAYAIFTSGTTGKPKGVSITHRNVTRLFRACDSWGHFDEQDVWSLLHSYAFDFSVWEVFGALLHGGRLVIIPNEPVGDMAAVARMVERHKVTVLSVTPTAFKNFLSAHDRLTHHPRMIVFGGEALWPEDVALWWTRYGEGSTRLINMYGITEITVHGTYQEMTPHGTGSCIGRPLADLGIALVDAKGKLCPAGLPGEIWVTGDGVADGYLHAPALNQERFTRQGWLGQASQRFYRSGDLAALGHDGRLYYLGRLDRQVKINGHRIELDEISGLIRQIEGIESCVPRVVDIDGVSAMLVAYYVAAVDPGPEGILQHLRRHLPPYALPARLIRIPSLPVTSNGKVDWNCLPDLLQDQISMARRPDSGSPVRTAWMNLVGWDQEADHRSFFEVGGDSLKAALLVRMVNELAGRPCFSLVDVFRYPTVLEQEEVVSVRLQEG